MTPLVPRSVTVYCSSSPRVDPLFVAVAREVGTLLGESGRELVYGGGSQGLMGEVARSCRDAGGRVVGIITEHGICRPPFTESLKHVCSKEEGDRRQETGGA